MREILTAERLREVLSYDAETGAFTWRIATGPNARPGMVAGTASKAEGYRTISIDGALHKAHRLAWLYVHGVWPQEQIDHINTRRDDNWIANLREATRIVNTQNQRTAHSNNKCGLLGVSERPGGRWIARIRANGSLKYLGTFRSPELAHDEYIAAKRNLHEGNTL